MFASLTRRLAAPLARLAPLAARVVSPVASMTPRSCSMPTAFAPSPAMWARPIITVDVHQPSDRFTAGDASSRNAMLADIARAEEIAISQFNRLVQDEVKRGTLRNGARRMKRFSRYVQPTLRRRDTFRASRWRQHRQKMETYMNWIQYRRRRGGA